MLLELNNDSYIAFDTHLAQYIYEKLVDHTVHVTLLGKVNIMKDSFHETLNTLEFCTKFIHTRCDHVDDHSIEIDNNYNQLANEIELKSRSHRMNVESEYSEKIESPCESLGFGRSGNGNLHSQNACKEVQISYLDNNGDSKYPNDIEQFIGT
jgi:hypothetical protein